MKLSAILKPLLDAKADHDMIRQMIEAFEAQEESALEKRRASDRERQARRRHVTSREPSTVTDGHDLTQAPTHTGSNNILPSEEGNIKTSPKGEAKSPSADADPLPISEAFDAYNEMAGNAGIPKVKDRTAQRIKALRPILAEHGIEGWLQALEAVTQTPFLLGANDRGWRADFDFLTTPKKFAKIREGSYERPAGPRLIHSSHGPPNRPLRQNERMQQKLLHVGQSHDDRQQDRFDIEAEYRRQYGPG